MGGWGMDDRARRGLLAAVLLGMPAFASGGAPGLAAEDSSTEAAEDTLSGGVVDGVEGTEGSVPADMAAEGPTGDDSDEVMEGALAEAVPAKGASEEQLSPVGPVPGKAAPGAEQKQGKKKKKVKAGEAQDDSLGENPDAADDKAAEEAQPVRVFGRVYARARADERQKYQRSLSIPSARVGVSTSLSNLEAEVTADLADDSLLKDAFVRLADDSKRFRLYGGQFKSPFLQRSLESSWDLPIQGRGLVEDYLTDTHQLGGRRLGLMGEMRLKGAWNLKLSVGLFEGGKDEAGVRMKEDAAARLSVRPFKPLTLGVSTYVAEALEVVRKHAVAADAELKLGNLAVTGEFTTGRLPLGPFTSQTLLAHWLLPLGSGEWGLQPVVGVEALQLRGGVDGRGHGLVGGLNVLLADRFKAQFQAERALRPGDEAPGLEYSLQLATRF
ncbi:OprO/OprP family phosphate-selective porin [Pyxidicoccus xibeiensis]|uniref:OprO/OprP family phosphate-selective porin n=1 Tax=Pyxidicoccus xibeiensis TaxID=2906759 RepID=UPI0020A7B16C|nr:OprO/OprP family phosphate-selective porin [Pyxidicoccus xibeiensis]MCP3141271.1 OprO/OprP family phosphate-selective porin [Pyxidicoccus xibeiensis]